MTSIKRVSTYLCLIIGFFMLSTGGAEAYFTTDQNAFTVDNKTGVFTIDFSFGHASHDITIPVSAQPMSLVESETATLGYTITATDGKPVNGRMMGIVLSSDAPVSNGFYKIKKGESATFTLLMLFVPDTKESRTYTASVSQLPFTFDGKQGLQLNPSELTYYTTPELLLHTSLFVFPQQGLYIMK